MYHNPVLLNESVESLEIKNGGIYVDLTFGGGGHSKEILKKIDKSGIIIIKAKILKKTNNFILAKAEIHFKNQKICDGIFHYINV